MSVKDFPNMNSAVRHLLLSALAIVCPALMAAGEWSMPEDFDSIGKPGSPWSAGRVNIDTGGGFRAFTVFEAIEQWRMWSFGEEPVWGSGLVWQAIHPVSGTEPGEVAIHPGNTFEKATSIRWTAPAGTPKTTYHVTGLFRAMENSGDRDFIIRLGDQTLMENRAVTYDQEFDFDFTASGGESLDFVVGCSESWTIEVAGFSATITQGTSPSAEKNDR